MNRTGRPLPSPPIALPRAAALCLSLALFASCALAQMPPGPKPREAVSLILAPVLLAAYGALQGLIAMLFPRWTRITRESIEQRRWLCVGWGAAIAVLAMLVLLAGGAAKGALAAVAAVIVLLVALVGACGFAGVAAAAGARLLPDSLPTEDRTPLQSLVGGLVVAFSCLTPVLGQLLGLLVCLAALGAAARALVTGLSPADSPTKPVEP
jgi:MFS family permease